MDGIFYKFFVANVNFNDDGHLKLNVNKFSNDNVWNASNQHRIVVPDTYYFSQGDALGVFV